MQAKKRSAQEIENKTIQGKNRAMLDSNPDEEDDENEDEDEDIRPSKRAKKAKPPVVLDLDDKETQMAADLMNDVTGDAGLDQGGVLEDQEDAGNGKLGNGGEDSEENPEDDVVVGEDEDEDNSPILS